jgi:hypothetical protein
LRKPGKTIHSIPGNTPAVSLLVGNVLTICHYILRAQWQGMSEPGRWNCSHRICLICFSLLKLCAMETVICNVIPCLKCAYSMRRFIMHLCNIKGAFVSCHFRVCFNVSMGVSVDTSTRTLGPPHQSLCTLTRLGFFAVTHQPLCMTGGVRVCDKE